MINIKEQLNKIELSENVKEHIKYTEEEFVKYMDKLSTYDDKSIELFLYDCIIKENLASSRLENALYSPKVIEFEEEVLFKYTPMSHEIIKELHKAILYGTNHPNPMCGIYRDTDAWIGKHGCSKEEARHVFMEPSEIPGYMDQFIEFYNDNGNRDIDHSFIKGAIAHVLLTTIHPFKDGNGRLSRILHHHKMIEGLNAKYNHNFTIPVINLSQHYEMTRGNYYQLQDNIDFNNIDNVAWNKWFDYTLNMIDENIYYLTNRLNEYNDTMGVIARF